MGVDNIIWKNNNVIWKNNDIRWENYIKENNAKYEKFTKEKNDLHYVYNEGDDVILKFRENNEMKNFKIKKGDIFRICISKSEEEKTIISNEQKMIISSNQKFEK